jgi:BlaI family transcriptional regulator, penicillinase repressor
MGKDIPKPTEAELAILQVLWQHGPSTVRFVNDQINGKKETGYTTTLKIMQIMTGKKMLEREEDGRMHIYKAALTEQETQQQLLDRFLDTAFRGSAAKMVMQALGNSKTSKKELDEIREFLKKMEGGKK